MSSVVDHELVSRYDDQNKNVKTVNSSQMQHYEMIKERDSAEFDNKDLYVSKETTLMHEGGNH